MMIKIAGCSCSGKDAGFILGGAGLMGIAFLFLVGGWNGQANGNLLWAWLAYSIGIVLVFAAKVVMWKGFSNSCPVHSMHGMMAMMDEKPKKNGKKRK